MDSVERIKNGQIINFISMKYFCKISEDKYHKGKTLSEN